MIKQIVIMLVAVLSFGLYSQSTAWADQVILDDLIVVGSGCVGQDCVNGENFGDDTLRLKENNTRILLEDTSTEPGYASQDWWLIANDSSNSGNSYFAIDSGEVTGYSFDDYVATKSPSTAFWIENYTTYIILDAAGAATCQDNAGNPITCPETFENPDAYSQPLDFIVDPSIYRTADNVTVVTNNGFVITEDAVIVSTSDNDRTLSNVADGVDVHDVMTVGQLDAVKTTLADVEALDDEPTAEMTAMDGRLESAQDAIVENRADIDGLQVAVESYQVSSDAPVASATGTGSTALGGGASAKTRDIAIGSNATVTADGSVAVGADTLVESQNSVAVGADSHVASAAEGAVALGQNAQIVSGATAAVAIGQNSVANEANTVSVGSVNNQRKITHVAAAVEESDAINFSQLQSLTASMDTRGLSKSLADADERTDDVGAMTTAFSALVPNVRSQGRTQVSFGLGHYSGSNALAAGMFHYVTDNVLLNLGVSSTFDSNATSLQTGLSWGW